MRVVVLFIIIAAIVHSAPLLNEDIVKKIKINTKITLEDPKPGDAWRHLIVFYSLKYDIDPLIMLAQAYTESSFRPQAINKNEKGGRWSRGLFQIQTRSAKYYCNMSSIDLMDPESNIKCAAIIHAKNKEKFTGDRFQAIKMLFAYNAGGYYICSNTHLKRGINCDLGYPVNYPYLTKTLYHYMRLQSEFKRLGYFKFKSVNFLSLSQKYIDSFNK